MHEGRGEGREGRESDVRIGSVEKMLRRKRVRKSERE
jgi:hypothetical protein